MAQAILIERDSNGCYECFALTPDEFQQQYAVHFKDMPAPDETGVAYKFSRKVHIWYCVVTVGDSEWTRFFTNMSYGLMQSDVIRGNLATIREDLFGALRDHLSSAKSEKRCMKLPSLNNKPFPQEVSAMTKLGENLDTVGDLKAVLNKIPDKTFLNIGNHKYGLSVDEVQYDGLSLSLFTKQDCIIEPMTAGKLMAAKQYLLDSGLSEDKADTILGALSQILWNTELFPAKNHISEIDALTQERIDALKKAQVYNPTQEAALSVACKALEAHQSGAAAYSSFVQKTKKDGTSLRDVSLQLWHLPETQPPDTKSAIEYAKLVLKSDSYTRVLECSAKGDMRFDPMYARLSICGIERSIAGFYQDAKRNAKGECVAPGEPIDHIIDPFTGDRLCAREAPWLYRGLWMMYFFQNPNLVEYAEQFDGFSNISETDGLEGRYTEIISAYMKGDRKRYIAVVTCSDWYKNAQRKLTQPLFTRIRSAKHTRDALRTSPVKEISTDLGR